MKFHQNLGPKLTLQDYSDANDTDEDDNSDGEDSISSISDDKEPAGKVDTDNEEVSLRTIRKN